MFKQRTKTRDRFMRCPLASVFLVCCAWATATLAAVENDPARHACLVATPDALTEAAIFNAVQNRLSAGNQHYRIVLQYNILRRSDGSGGFTQLDLIDEHMRHLNWGFRDTPFVYVRIPGVRYIDDDGFYQLDSISEAFNLYRTYNTPGVANIYMHEGTLFNNPNARAYTSPTLPNRGHTYGDTRIGLPANIAYSPHELGHFFFLLHPYESAFAGTECVARTNCQLAGDLVCDTPASPIVFGGNTLRTGQYFGSSIGPCPGDGAYAPLTDLWMEAGWASGKWIWRAARLCG